VKKILAASLVTLFFSCGNEEDIVDDPEANPAVEVNLEISTLLSLVNSHRSAGAVCGSDQLSAASALQWDDALAQAALDHSNDMHANDYFSHTGLNGSSFSERVVDAGFEGTPVGENIAWGYPSLEEVIQGWMESEGHCSNIMNGSATHIGVAKSDQGLLWTMVLGRE